MSAKTETFDLPSGAKIEFRALTLKEENILASSRGRRQHSALDRVLSACVVQVHDAGPYKDLGQKPDWDKMLQGDRFVAMIRLRVISYREGEDYQFKTTCPDCKKRTEQSINLLSELPVRPLSEEAMEAMVNGAPFTAEIAEAKVTYSLSFGEHAKRAEKLREQNPKRTMAAALRSRILEVEGVDKRDILDWLDGEHGDFPGLTSDDAEDLRDAFDRVDCGIDTEIEVECPSCWAVWSLSLPFDDGFFLPQRGRKKRRQEREAERSHGAD